MSNQRDPRIRALMVELAVSSLDPPDLEDALTDEPGTNAVISPKRDRTGRPPGRRRGLAVAAAGFAVVLLAAIPTVLLLVDRDSTGPAETETTTPPAATSAPTSVPATSAPAATPSDTSDATAATTEVTTIDIAWERISDDALTNGFIQDVVAAGPGLIAVGGVSDPSDSSSFTGGDAVVWVSADGRSWDRIDDPEIFGLNQFIVGVVTGPLGIVAFGQDRSDAAIWTSQDGLAWTRVSDESLGGKGMQWINDVAPGGPGWVAVGNGDLDPLVWVSADGVEWNRIEDEDLLAGEKGRAQISSVTTGGPGLVAVGSVGFRGDTLGGGSDQHGTVWVSEDGLDWQRLPDDTIGEESALWAVSSDLWGLLSEVDGAPLVAWGALGWWSSNDGISWTQADAVSGLSLPPSSYLAVEERRAVAASPGRAVFLWASADGGISWERLDTEDDPAFGDGWPFPSSSSVAWLNSQFVVLGGVGGDAAVWIGTWETE